MQELDLILGQNEKFSFIEVVFNDGSDSNKDGKKYHYKTVEEFTRGDKAVVNVHGILKIVTITNVDCANDLQEHISYKWIVQRVDFTNYEHCKEVEGDVKQKLNGLRVNKLRKELEADLKETLGSDGVAEIKKIARL